MIDNLSSLLKIESLTKVFDGVRAVDELNLEIRKGEIFALLGGSGSGKSTLLRMIAGFEKPTQGRIYLDDQDITDLAPHQRPINMMFQSYALFPHMSVEQNIAFGLKRDGLPRDEITARVAEMLSLVDMSNYGKRKPHQLSGGQRQRVALARSLAKRPKLLLLDEPMGALDKKLRTRMQLELVGIIEQVGVTCVMVTHDQEEAMTMADRIAIMDAGWLAQIGTPKDIYEAPNSRSVAEFVGLVNLFEGEIADDASDHALIQCDQLSVPIYVGYGVTTQLEDKRVCYALRPEKIVLSSEHPNQPHNWAAGVIDDIAYLGGLSIYYVRLASGARIQCVQANALRQADRLTWQTHVYLSWEDDAGVVLLS